MPRPIAGVDCAMQATAARGRISFGLGASISTAARSGFVAMALALAPLSACEVPQIPPPGDVAAAPADATVLDSGLAYKVLTAGTGTKPRGTDTVRVHYTGWTTDGKTFDSSISRGEPIEFPLHAVIPGWTEGLQHMQQGAKHRLWIPESLAYKGRSGKPAGTLVFDVELLEIK
jgi:hypothetical protein